jgi:hypothetical protein
MELLLFGAFLIMVGWAIDKAIEEHKEKKEKEERARQAEEQSRRATARQAQLSDPRWVGAELVRLVSVGDAQGIHRVVETVPDWPVRAALLDAAKRLAVLARGVGMAEPAGVPAAMLEGGRNPSLTSMRTADKISLLPKWHVFETDGRE